MMDWKIGLILLVVAITIMAITKYVSLGSIIGAALYPIIVFIWYRNDSIHILFALCLAILAIYRHRANIKRLLNGTESKLGSKVKVNR